MLVNNHQRALFIMEKYRGCISEVYFDLLESVVLGIKDQVFIPQSEIDKWEKEKQERDTLNKTINLTAQRNNIGIACEKEGDLDGAIEQYELNVSDRVEATHSYDRLMILYRKQKMFKDELRVIDAAIKVFSRVNEKGYRNAINKPENRKYLSELQTAMEECKGIKNDEGWYIFSPYPVLKWILRRDKVEKLYEKTTGEKAPEPPKEVLTSTGAISPTGRPISDEDVISEVIVKKGLIQAIKETSSIKGTSLKDSKEFVDRLVDIRSLSPHRGKGCLLLLVVPFVALSALYAINL